MTAHDAVVYDLDGSLVRLAVDWAAVERAVTSALGAAEVDSVWEALDVAERTGRFEEVDGIVAEHEREGARTSERLPAADDLPLPVPVAVCSLNCEDACHVALERHGLAEHVDAVVGRDTVGARKPDPAPLLAALEALGAEPGDAVFVGDSRRDEITAERTGVAFEYVGDGPSHE